MNAADVKILRRKVELILGPLFMRPLRAREITDEMKDHALEASDAGEDDPVATLGSTKMLRRTIGRSFLLETAVFLITFIIIYSAWRMLTEGYIALTASLVWIIPLDGYNPPNVEFNPWFFAKFLLFVTPAIIMAAVFKRWHYLTIGRGWVRWLILLLLVLVLNTFVFNLFFRGLQQFIQYPENDFRYLVAGNMGKLAWQEFLYGFQPWKTGLLEYYMAPFIFLLVPIGMFAYACPRLGILGRIAILTAAIIFIERSDIFRFLNSPGWVHQLYYHACISLRHFGYGLWIMFYLNVYDHIWNWVGRLNMTRKEMDLAGE